MINNPFLMPFLCGFIFVIAALFMLKFPPKKINYLYGYRTSTSIKNIQNWRFAQKYSSFRMIEAGVFLILVSFIFPYFNLTETQSVVAGSILLIISVIYILLKTEKAIKQFEKIN